ncbi:hypothetical protein [Bradyrhizobium daqingense]|uniref:hypothetical protein n=1 Tax=Bradyrhizobium daqingense TaxID=993502 RepID=UPI0038350295
MAKFVAMRMLEVRLIALLPQKWEWQVWKDDLMLMSGYETSRETAQIEGNSALFHLLRTPN